MRLRCTLGIVVLGLSGLILSLGCGGNQVNTIISGEVSTALQQLDANSVTLRLINQSESGQNLQLDLLIDGFQQTFSCPADNGLVGGVCDFPLTPCPKEVDALQERMLDSKGRFTGGRNFNNAPDFSFTAGEFSCGSALIYQFTDRTAKASVL
jgi:hypothetical protein